MTVVRTRPSSLPLETAASLRDSSWQGWGRAVAVLRTDARAAFSEEVDLAVVSIHAHTAALFLKKPLCLVDADAPVLAGFDPLPGQCRRGLLAFWGREEDKLHRFVAVIVNVDVDPLARERLFRGVGDRSALSIVLRMA
jgi:hypothetical protein